jgi:protein gp37
MSDLLHENVTDDMRDRIFGVMWACEYLGKGDDCWPGHVFQILTKRPERMKEYLSIDRRELWAKWAITYAGGNNPDMLYDQVALADHVHPRIWLGVAVENQKAADERIPILLQTPAELRFLSREPLLGHVDICEYLGIWWNQTMQSFERFGSKINCQAFDGVSGIGWAIVGGESGHGSRPMHPDWARGLRDQCAGAGVPFFFISRIGKKAAGHLLDHVEHHAFPEVR